MLKGPSGIYDSITPVLVLIKAIDIAVPALRRLNDLLDPRGKARSL